ncbi:helix-turn-helix domain-containing protein [Terrimonas alba]|uniref:helix-turn-helix domain-containing protein n=1 Tax=Terrimonas alba TaxID=3349636 RepID=UPI0035F38C3C
MLTSTAPITSWRKKEIVQQYLAELSKYIQDLKEGKTDEVLEIRDFAGMLHIHPVHLSHTIKEVTGRSTCELFEERLVNVSKELLLDKKLSIAEIAIRLTYDPSNFTKFFKKFTGMTPKKFRLENLSTV